MQCPDCAGHNFAWARRCDHCGHVFRTDAPKPTVDRGPSNPEHGVVLDLGRHAPDAAAGKTIAINGVEYTIQERSRTIRNAHVYPLLNQRTGLILFELKVFICDAGSPRYESIRKRDRNVFAEKASVATEADPRASFFIIEEVYEQNGGLVGLQRSLQTDPGPAYHLARMRQASTHLQSGDVAAAIREYDAVLALNPNHTSALNNKAACLARLGDLRGALALLEQALAVEPNAPDVCHNAATFQLALGRCEAATLTLAQGLKRYAGEYGLWIHLLEIATTHDTLDLVDDVVEQGMAVIQATKVAAAWRSRIDESRDRWRRYCAALDQAVLTQLSKNWNQALTLLEQAAGLSTRNAAAELNACICLFWKGDFDASLQRALACQIRLNGHHSLACGVLLLAASARLEQWERCRGVALDLCRRCADLDLLPGMPAAVKHSQGRLPDPLRPSGASGFAAADCFDDFDSRMIVEVLSSLPLHAACDEHEVRALSALGERYERALRAQNDHGDGVTDSVRNADIRTH